ncbi:MAG TPA: pilus assembly protein TadG-related protein [Paucimonas sp.]|nr:pilus assembly protein TadG-related protein [Paucimonas sp.]
MHSIADRHRQGGAVIITVALALLFLLGFMGIALDFGHLFIVKTELQTAMDSCALAAAQELDGASGATDRATSAGMTAGKLNKVNFQGVIPEINNDDIVFSDKLNGSYSRFTAVADAKYAKCTHTRSGMEPWLLQAMSAFSGNAAYKASQSVGAVAVATRVSSQSNCVMPVGVCQYSAANPMGFTRGDWIPGVTNDQDDLDASGQYRWLDFSGNGGGTREIKDLLIENGQCGLPGMDTEIGKAGKSNGAVEAWNTRFGVYKGSYDAAGATPDLTGYAWYENTATVPLSKKGRYDDPGTNGFQYHRSHNDPYEGDNKNPDTKNLNTQGTKSDTATHQKGANRRVITTAVVDCSTMTLKGFACMLMLHPLEKNASGKNSKMWLEFISDANTATNNPCVTAGTAGGTGGRLVPALVQ